MLCPADDSGILLKAAIDIFDLNRRLNDTFKVKVIDIVAEHLEGVNQPAVSLGDSGGVTPQSAAPAGQR